MSSTPAAKTDRERADAALVRMGLAADRRQAASLILAGDVHAQSGRVETPGQTVKKGEVLTVRARAPYASRGGLKLDYALKVFPVDLKGKVVADVGSSTGGFTDRALEEGARKVYAIDVGKNLLAYRLRTDPRVVVMEGTNFKDVDAASLGERVDVVLCDVSFISCRGVFKAFASVGETAVVLVKPQFEASKAEMRGTGGLAPKAAGWRAIERLLAEAAASGWHLVDYSACPIKGRVAGNTEYVTLWDRTPT